MLVKFKVVKKGNGACFSIDRDNNSKITFEAYTRELPQVMKLTMMAPIKEYNLTIDIPEIKED